jgi:hypothetical protein
VAESDGLENRCGCTPTVGSNPTPSAGGQPPAGQACPPLPAARQDCGQGGSPSRLHFGWPEAGQPVALPGTVTLRPLDRRG